MSAALGSIDTPWAPGQLGLPRALVIAMAAEAVIVVLLLWPWHHTHALPTAKPQQVTTVAFVKLPPPPPPKPVVPKLAPPPPVPKPKIVIPKKVKPTPIHRPKPVHHVIHKVVHRPKPKPKPVVRPKVIPHPAPQVVKAPLPAPHVAPVSGPSPSVIAAYAEVLHALIQNNVLVGAMIQQLGLSGSVRVRFTLGPGGGQVRSVRVLTNNANPLIRQAALRTVRQLDYPPFPKSLGKSERSFEVTVQISSGS